MRLFIFFILFFFMYLPASAETLIKQQLNVSIDIRPKQYLSNIVIYGSKELQKLKTLSLENKNTIIKTFNSINNFLDENSICKGGSFAVNPSYFYKDGKKTQEGFEVDFSLNCEFEESKMKEYNAILERIEIEVSKNPLLIFAFPRVSLGVSEAELYNSDSMLNVELVNLALKKAKEYGELTKKKCSIREIILGNVGRIDREKVNMEAYFMQSSKNILEDVALPSAKDMRKSLSGDVVFSCK